MEEDSLSSLETGSESGEIRSQNKCWRVGWKVWV